MTILLGANLVSKSGGTDSQVRTVKYHRFCCNEPGIKSALYLN